MGRRGGRLRGVAAGVCMTGVRLRPHLRVAALLPKRRPRTTCAAAGARLSAKPQAACWPLVGTARRMPTGWGGAHTCTVAPRRRCW